MLYFCLGYLWATSAQDLATAFIQPATNRSIVIVQKPIVVHERKTKDVQGQGPSNVTISVSCLFDVYRTILGPSMNYVSRQLHVFLCFAHAMFNNLQMNCGRCILLTKDFLRLASPIRNCRI